MSNAGHLEELDFNIADFNAGEKAVFLVIYNQWATPLLRFVENFIENKTTQEDTIAQAFYELFHARVTIHSEKEIWSFLVNKVRELSIAYLDGENINRPLATKNGEAKNKAIIHQTKVGLINRLASKYISTLFQKVNHPVNECPCEGKK